MHVFELGPKIFEMHVFAQFLILKHLTYTIHLLNNTNLPMHSGSEGTDSLRKESDQKLATL